MNKYIIEIKWAFIFMVVGLLWMLMEKLSGLHSTHIDKHMYLTNLFALPAILMFVLALKDKKKNFYHGQMSFKQGFISGLLISVIIAVFGPVTQWITSYVITPEYFSNVIEYSLETGYYNTRKEAEAFFNYGNYAKQSMLWGLIMGVVTSVIVAFFVRTKNK